MVHRHMVFLCLVAQSRTTLFLVYLSPPSNTESAVLAWGVSHTVARRSEPRPSASKLLPTSSWQVGKLWHNLGPFLACVCFDCCWYLYTRTALIQPAATEMSPHSVVLYTEYLTWAYGRKG